LFYLMKNRSKIKKLHPEWSFGRLGEEVGKQWKAIDDEERACKFKFIISSSNLILY
jgi:hypothetical protein